MMPFLKVALISASLGRQQDDVSGVVACRGERVALLGAEFTHPPWLTHVAAAKSQYLTASPLRVLK
jgi:hypothetical protein